MTPLPLHIADHSGKTSVQGKKTVGKKLKRCKSLRKREKRSINSSRRKDGWRDKGMRRMGGGNSSVFLFNPLFLIIPLGELSILERKRRKKKRGGGQRVSDKGNKVQESEVCSP